MICKLNTWPVLENMRSLEAEDAGIPNTSLAILYSTGNSSFFLLQNCNLLSFDVTVEASYKAISLLSTVALEAASALILLNSLSFISFSVLDIV